MLDVLPGDRPGPRDIEEGETLHPCDPTHPGTGVDLNPFPLTYEVVDVHIHWLAELEAVSSNDRWSKLYLSVVEISSCHIPNLDVRGGKPFWGHTQGLLS